VAGLVCCARNSMANLPHPPGKVAALCQPMVFEVVGLGGIGGHNWSLQKGGGGMVLSQPNNNSLVN